MERWLFAAVFGLFTILSTGCGKSDPPAVDEAHRAEHGLDPAHLSSGYAKEQPTAPGHDKAEAPDKVVAQFLEAARSGDQRKLAGLMTKVARDETISHNINFELESYQNATFQVGEVEYLPAETKAAHVACKWTDHDGDASFTHDVIWVMRKEEPGWRVVGMITRPFPDQPPVAFNYENVKELMETKASIEQEVKRRTEEEERQSRRAARKTATPK
jgi:hypothetical protein